MDRSISLLGTSPDVVSVSVEQKVGWWRRRLVPREFGYLTWTVDGVRLAEVVARPDGELRDLVTPIRNDYASRTYEVNYLRAILGELVNGDGTVMPDGRVPLLVCPIDFDLSCATLTADIARSDEIVEWRDIAWQVDYEPLDLAEQDRPAISLAFERNQYEALLNSFLEVEMRPSEEPSR